MVDEAGGGVVPKALTRGSPTALRWVATACWLKGSRTQPSAPTAARLTTCLVWLAMKKRATRGLSEAGKVMVEADRSRGFAEAASQVMAGMLAVRTGAVEGVVEGPPQTLP